MKQGLYAEIRRREYEHSLDTDAILHDEHGIGVEHRVETMCNGEHRAGSETLTNDLCKSHEF